jgi:hypothetical protein
MNTIKPFGRLVAVIAVLGLLAATAAAGERTERGHPAPPSGPIIGPGSWFDALDDTQGLSWLQGTRHGEGRLELGKAQPLGQDVKEIISLAEGADGRFYMGADNAHLWHYDDSVGLSKDLGAPVPDECNT